MEITYYGHNCIFIDTDISILTDPFILDNPLAKHIDIEQIKPDYVLITHGHRHHIADAIRIAGAYEATIIANPEMVHWFNLQGYANTRHLNLGGVAALTDNTLVKLVQAQHSNSLPDKSYGGIACSYIISTDQQTLFIAGDTALHADMEIFGKQYAFDCAALPIGGTFTMDVQDAIQSAKMLRCEKVLGCHYNTFESIKIDTNKAREDFQAAGITLALPSIGEAFEI